MKFILLIFTFIAFSLSAKSIEAKEFWSADICPRYIDYATIYLNKDKPIIDLYEDITKDQRLERLELLAKTWLNVHSYLPRLSQSERDYVEKEKKEAKNERLLELLKKKEWVLYRMNNQFERLHFILDEMHVSLIEGNIKKEISQIVDLNLNFDDLLTTLIEMEDYGYIKVPESENLKILCTLNEDLYFIKVLLEKIK